MFRPKGREGKREAPRAKPASSVVPAGATLILV